MLSPADGHALTGSGPPLSQAAEQSGGKSSRMCYGRCARCIGHSLAWLATLCIVANVLLYFPNGETKYASENHLSRFVWFFSGILGGGLLVSRSEIITALEKNSFLLDEMFAWKVFYQACFQIQDFCSFLF